MRSTLSFFCSHLILFYKFGGPLNPGAPKNCLFCFYVNPALINWLTEKDKIIFIFIFFSSAYILLLAFVKLFSNNSFIYKMVNYMTVANVFLLNIEYPYESMNAVFFKPHNFFMILQIDPIQVTVCMVIVYRPWCTVRRIILGLIPTKLK